MEMHSFEHEVESKVRIIILEDHILNYLELTDANIRGDIDGHLKKNLYAIGGLCEHKKVIKMQGREDYARFAESKLGLSTTSNTDGKVGGDEIQIKSSTGGWKWTMLLLGTHFTKKFIL